MTRTGWRRTSGMRESVSRRPSPLKMFAFAFLLFDLVLIALLVLRQHELASRIEAQTRTQPPQEGDRYLNGDLQYSFRYPDGWDLDDSGDVTKLLSPARDLALGIGKGPSGDVLSSSESLVDELTARYRKVEAGPPEVTRVDGALAVEVRGTAVNEHGALVHFSLIAIKGGPANYALTAFSSEPLARADVRRRIQRFLSSLEVG